MTGTAGRAGLSARLLARAAFRPSNQVIACAKERRVIDNGAERIETWIEHVRPDTMPDLFVLRFLGARGRAEHGTSDPVNRFPGLAAQVWIANPPGFGASSGGVCFDAYARSALRVFDALAVDAGSRPIWVQGQSLGSLAALHVAAERPVDWLILRNVTPMPQVLAGWLPGLRPWFAERLRDSLPPALDAMANAAKLRAPTLFVTSRGDRVSPLGVQQGILAACTCETRQLLVNCGHDDHVLPPADEANYRALVAAQLRRLGLTGVD